jgi:uncharacterized protein (DUF1684 family)
LFLSLSLVWLAMSGAASSSEATSHRAEWEQWRARRLESLRREDGWLSLIGLVWLEEGENSVGSAPGSRILLPAGKAPARMGSILLEKGAVSMRAEPGSGLTADGKPVTAMPLATDAGGGPATVLKRGSVSFYVIARGSRLGVRVKDSEAETRRAFHGIEPFPYDERFRVEARFEPYVPPRDIAVPNVLGTVETQPSPGAMVFELEGKTYRLDPVLETGESDLFVIFGDRTNGHETYGGGRFLYAKPAVGGKTILDFNRVYNPPCVFTPYATCPLPPKQNKLPIRIEAGEKTYGEH